MAFHTCMTTERQCPFTLQVLTVFFLFGPDGAEEFLGIELPGGTWLSVWDTRLLNISILLHFIYLFHFASFLFIPFPFFYHVLIHRKTKEKGRSVSGKIGHVTMENKILRHTYSFSSHIPLVLLIIPYRPLTSSFPCPCTLWQEQVTSQLP